MFYFLSLSVALFAIGVFGLLSRREIVGKLVSIILMFSAVLILFATYNRFVQSDGIIGVVYIAFIMLTVISGSLFGAFLVYRQYSSNNNSDQTDISLFE